MVEVQSKRVVRGHDRVCCIELIHGAMGRLDVMWPSALARNKLTGVRMRARARARPACALRSASRVG